MALFVTSAKLVDVKILNKAANASYTDTQGDSISVAIEVTYYAIFYKNWEDLSITNAGFSNATLKLRYTWS
jgi:hypothetical protein